MIKNILLEKVKEKGIVKIILDYKNQLEMSEITCLNIINDIMLNFYLDEFEKKIK